MCFLRIEGTDRIWFLRIEGIDGSLGEILVESMSFRRNCLLFKEQKIGSRGTDHKHQIKANGSSEMDLEEWFIKNK